MESNELLDLTAAQAAAAIERGDLDSGELFAAYRARAAADDLNAFTDRKSTRLNSSHIQKSRMPSSA